MSRYNLSSKYDPEALLLSVKSSLADSIDLNAYINPPAMNASRLYAARQILTCMYRGDRPQRLSSTNAPLDIDTSRQLVKTNDWRRLRVGESRNWIAALAQKFVERVESASALGNNQLTIVTFNYDTIIEDAFRYFVSGNHMFRDVDEAHLPRVLHVYGKFSDLPDTIESEGPIIQAANSIRFINDPDRDETTLTAIRQAIRSARRIYILGFSADPLNTELIDLPEASATTYAVNYDGNINLNSRLSRLRVEPKNILQGTEISPICAGKAAELGFFDMQEPQPSFTSFWAG